MTRKKTTKVTGYGRLIGKMLFSCVLIVMMLAALSGCGRVKTADELYKEAVSKIDSTAAIKHTQLLHMYETEKGKIEV